MLKIYSSLDLTFAKKSVLKTPISALSAGHPYPNKSWVPPIPAWWIPWKPVSFQNSLMFRLVSWCLFKCIDRVSWAEWVFGKTVCFQGGHFVFVSESRVVVMMVCGGGSVGVLMKFVWRSLGVGMRVLGWGWGVFGVWVGGWVSFG